MMVLIAVVLSLAIVFLVGYLVGFLHGRDAGEAATYDAVERWYEGRGSR